MNVELAGTDEAKLEPSEKHSLCLSRKAVVAELGYFVSGWA